MAGRHDAQIRGDTRGTPTGSNGVRRYDNRRARAAGRIVAAIAAMIGLAPALAAAGEQPQFGQGPGRNMVSPEKGLPTSFDPATGKNVKWAVKIGRQSYATPIVAGGKVFIGTNNDRPRDPRLTGDRGVLMCLNAADGALAWQLVVPKLADDPYKDWPRVGLCSPPTVEGDRVYVVTNRAEVLCLDINGQADGNDGPFTDEGTYVVPAGKKAITPGPTDADILWRFDMVAGAGIWPHDSAHSSILIHNDRLYLNTGNGVDNTHKVVRRPDGPSLIVLDKATGKLIGRDREGIGPRIFHSTWASPSMGTVAGKPLVFFGGGDGVVYAFDPLAADKTVGGAPATLKRVWRFDCDPTAPKENVSRYLRKRTVGPSNIMGMPVFHGGRVYVAAGGDIWWGKRAAWLKCIDAGKTGDVTETAEVWSYPLNRHCCSTPSIQNGLVYIADVSGVVHCSDAATGRARWTHDTNGDIWGSTLLADGKVYVGTRRGEVFVLAAGPNKKLLASVKLDSAINGVLTAADGVLYVATMRHIYALAANGGQK